ncbi:MAG: glutamate--tRNA ligase family protein [Bacteroidota bacterium]
MILSPLLNFRKILEAAKVKNQNIRTRLAPTPSGYLHAGNAFSFVLTWLLARASGPGNSLRLRIDDNDSTRLRREYSDDLFRSLRRLGLDWDEGPQNPAEAPLFSQTLRQERYLQLLGRLYQTGHLYACTCSRKDIAAQTSHECPCLLNAHKLKSDPESALGYTVPHDTALRLHTPADLHITVPDLSGKAINVHLLTGIPNPVLMRRDGIPAYHIASLADDIDYKINLVVRGDDLLPSTALHLHMATLLGEQSFPDALFLHHPLLTGPDGEKLSKSIGSRPVTPENTDERELVAFFRMFSLLAGIPGEAVSAIGLLRQVKKEIS